MAMIPELIHLDELPWEPFGGKTKEIFRKSLTTKIFPSGLKATLTLARPGGEFPEHIDPYAHIFFILEGEGEASVEGQTLSLKKGAALTVAAGKKHGYRNAGKADLILITLNIFE
ncbi:MAG: cupin domain-containing protein [Deltaproteobacteria bacterium]|nr:cupin domain-containing protein [Deltaproteobacteria bacterium]